MKPKPKSDSPSPDSMIHAKYAEILVAQANRTKAATALKDAQTALEGMLMPVILQAIAQYHKTIKGSYTIGTKPEQLKFDFQLNKEHEPLQIILNVRLFENGVELDEEFISVNNEETAVGRHLRPIVDRLFKEANINAQLKSIDVPSYYYMK
jgi:hypothetical protein